MKICTPNLNRFFAKFSVATFFARTVIMSMSIETLEGYSGSVWVET